MSRRTAGRDWQIYTLEGVGVKLFKAAKRRSCQSGERGAELAERGMETTRLAIVLAVRRDCEIASAMRTWRSGQRRYWVC